MAVPMKDDEELPPGRAEREYALLRGMEDRRLPAVPVGPLGSGGVS